MNKLSFKEIINFYSSKMDYKSFVENILNDKSLGDVEEVFKECDIFKSRSCYKVIFFKEHDIYIKISGYYDNFEDRAIWEFSKFILLKEVRPFEIIKTNYK